MSNNFTFVCPINGDVSPIFKHNAGVGGETYFEKPYNNGCNPSDILTINDYVIGGKIINIMIHTDKSFIIDILNMPEKYIEQSISEYNHNGSSISTYTLDEFNTKYARAKYDYPQYVAYESIGKEWNNIENVRDFVDGNLALLRKGPRNSSSNSHVMVARIKYL